MSDLMMFHCTHGEEEPERATVPFIAASVAVASGQRAVVVCTADAVWLGTRGVAERVTSEGQPPLVDLLEAVVSGGGEVWLCSACTRPRDIDEDDTVDGATIVGAARIVDELAAGARSITLT